LRAFISEGNTMQTQTTQRLAFTPAEFAATCGRHASWAYRLLYSGKIRAVTELGRILIPASELQRVLSLAQPYDPKPKPKPEPKAETEHEETGQAL
jgi:Helix-turn-helix domain